MLSMASTFGNTNMVAEFIAMVVVLGLGDLLKQKNKRWPHGRFILLFMLFAYLIVLNSRSVLGSCWLAVIYLLLTSALSRRNKILYTIILILLPVLGLLAAKLGLVTTALMNPGKLKSLHERVEIIQATIAMIKANPWGVGLGMYDYAFIPYKMQIGACVSEVEIERSPHNEWLRYLSEDGIPLTLLGISFWISVIKEGIKNITQTEMRIIAPFYILIFIQSLVQFPLENPLPLLLTAIMVGYFLAITEKQTFIQRESKIVSHWLLLPVIGLYSAFAVAEGIASHLIATAPLDRTATTKACRLTSSNWMACLFALESNLNQGENTVFRHGAYQELYKRPYNFPVIYLLGASYIAENKMQLGCHYWQQYDKIFNNKSSKHSEIQNICGSVYYE